MPDHRSHRGMHPQDAEHFSARSLPPLRAAVAELSWLLTRGYAETSSLKLVGDRHALVQRQRTLVGRASCTDAQRTRRQSIRVPADFITDQMVFIDGFNLLITLEAAMGGGILFFGRDGALRDLSSVHGSYRSVDETDTALLLLGETLTKLRPKAVHWLLDQPVSNSGRLAQKIRDLAAERHWPWEAKLVMNPDRDLMELTDSAVITSDALILDHIPHWLPFSEMIVSSLPAANHVIDLRDNVSEAQQLALSVLG